MITSGEWDFLKIFAKLAKKPFVGIAKMQIVFLKMQNVGNIFAIFFFIVTFVVKMIMSLLTSTPLLVSTFIMVLALLELRQHPDRKPLVWLAIWAAATAMLYAGHFVFFNHAYRWVPLSDTVYVSMNLLVYPLYLFYISELTDSKPLSTQPASILFLTLMPALGGIFSGSLYYLMDSVQTERFIHDYLYGGMREGLKGAVLAQAWVHTVCHSVFTLQVLMVVVCGHHKIKAYNHTVQQLYADTDNKEIHHISGLLKLLVVISFVSIIANTIGRNVFVGPSRLVVPSLLFSALIFAIGYASLQQRFSMRDIKVDNDKVPLQSIEIPVVTSDNEMSMLFSQFDTLMDKKRLYLQHDLQLNDAALLLGTNRTYLLRAIKSNASMTFKEYINRKRIAYAEQLLRNNPKLPKSEVATLSGYDSLSAFYRNFSSFKSTPPDAVDSPE